MVLRERMCRCNTGDNEDNDGDGRGYQMPGKGRGGRNGWGGHSFLQQEIKSQRMRFILVLDVSPSLVGRRVTEQQSQLWSCGHAAKQAQEKERERRSENKSCLTRETGEEDVEEKEKRMQIIRTIIHCRNISIRVQPKTHTGRREDVVVSLQSLLPISLVQS